MICRKCKTEAPPDAVYCPHCGKELNPSPKKRRQRTRLNGTGTAFQRGKTWTAKVTVGRKTVVKDGKVRSIQVRATKGGFLRKKDALDYCDTLMKEHKAGAEREKLTMKQVYEAWLPIHSDRVGKSTMDCYKAAWKYFAPLHDMIFADIDVDDLQECIDECDKGRRTKENMKALASLLMKWAIPRHQTDLNYAEFLHTGNDAKGTRPAFTKEQVELIRRQIDVTPYADYVYCLIYTGFRPSEMFNLTPADTVGNVLYGGAKTRVGKGRAVPINPKISLYIERLRAKVGMWLFPRLDGTQMTAAYFRDACFYPVLAAAGIQPIPDAEHPAYYVPYSCRHTFANMLKACTGSDKDKAGLIGHEDYRTTKRHYQSAEIEALTQIILQM